MDFLTKFPPVPHRQHPRDEEPRPRPEASPTNDSNCKNRLSEDKIARILSVYSQAKDEYYHADAKKCFKAAQFLRDTTENALAYLDSDEQLQFDRGLLGELRGVLKFAKEKAVELSGGKERRFDNTDRRPSTKVTKRPRFRRGLVDSYRPRR